MARQPAPAITKRPMFNAVPFQPTVGTSRIGGMNTDYRRFWDWFKKSPELIGMINVLTTDIIGDRPEFVDLDGKPLGRNTRRKAERFWKTNRVKEAIKAILFDLFVTGDGYGWIGKLDEKERHAKAKEIVERFAASFKMKEDVKNHLLIKATQDEDMKKPKRFDYIPSSTVMILTTPQEITGYVQNVAGITINFKPKEIIHFRLNTIDGQPQGFSPIQALVTEIVLLGMIKENMLAYFRNGGAPSKFFTLPDEIANSPNHQFLVQTLQRFNSVANRNGNYVFTGNVELNDLTENIKDMEYKELALYLVSTAALALNIPVTRLPFLVGSASSKGDSGGIAESGYWNMISEKQDLIEDLMNFQMFEEMGWTIRLNRKYKQDEVREAQTANMSTDTVAKKQAIYREHGKTLTGTRIAQLLGDPQDEVTELTPDQMMTPEQKTGMMNQNLLDNISINKEPDALKRADTKRNSANQAENKGAGV